MARTQVSTSSNLRVTKQSPMLWEYAGQNTFFANLVGPLQKGMYEGDFDGNTQGARAMTDSNAVVQIVQDFSKGKGDIVTFPLMVPLSSTGVINDGDLEDNEEAMEFLDWSLTLKSIGNAVRGDGELQEKRVAFNLKAQARPALLRWIGEKIDHYAVRAMSGLASDDGNVEANAPSTNRIIYGGQNSSGTVELVADDNTLSATDNLMGANFLSTVKRHAQLSTPKIRPIKIGGKNYYVAFLHPYQIKALKASTTEWASYQKDAADRGKENPLFTGANAIIDGVIIHEWERIEYRTGAGGTDPTEYFDSSSDVAANGVSIARGLFCGAQACVIAFGQKPKLYPKTLDYDKWGLGLRCLVTAGKPEFDSEDYGVVCMDTAIVLDS